METKRVTTGHPDWLAVTSFFVRSRGLLAKRSVENALHRIPLLPQGAVEDFPHVLAESVSKLQTSTDPRERPLLLGKIQNLRVACRRIHRRILAPGGTFSFWRQIGPPWRLRGFYRGREVRDGCVIPTFGGGLCQLSGSLLEVVVALDLDLLERHRHTALPADVPRDMHRDATLFWNYVDLRFRSRVPLLFECFLTRTELVVRLRGRQPQASGAKIEPCDVAKAAPLPRTLVESCLTCNQTGCSRHVTESPKNVKSAFLLDDYQPEFARFVRGYIKDGDRLLLPFISPEGWTNSDMSAWHDVRSSSWFRFRRSLTLRWAVIRGVTVAKAHFELAELLAKLYERRMGHDVEHLYVAQALLPHLWRTGVLGGRTFDVLMQRLPVASLEQQLDTAARLYPQSKTLVEFRAPRWFAEAEQQALTAARIIFTPHAQIAALLDQAVCLPWESPPRRNGNGKRRNLMVFLGPTLARKGAYAVREAVRKTGLSLTVLGPELEESGFWRNLPVVRQNPLELPWERVHTVVQPALFEYWPRQLLRAHAAGANLVVSPLCGLEENRAAGIYHVPFGDVDALAATLTRLLTNQGDLPCEY
jgi:hypothetical protein